MSETFEPRPGEEIKEEAKGKSGSRSGSRPSSIGSEIVINMSILMMAAVILISVILNWIHNYLVEDYMTYARFLLIPYVILFALTVAVFGWRMISRIILQPLRELLDATHKVAAGDLSTRVEVSENNELGQLARAFNEMTMRLESNRGELIDNLEEMKRLNQDLAQTQSELLSSEKLASVGRLAAGVGHEIGNPLSAIAGYLDILARRNYLQEPDLEMIERIQSEVKRINEIIKELLDYSRPQQDCLAPVQLNESIGSALTLMSGQKGFDKLEVKTQLTEIPSLQANHSSLQQLLVNLIMNALYEMPDGGKLTITTGRAEYKGRAGVELVVADTGPGIPLDFQDRVFDPFFTTKEPGQGTGLGLSICQRIVENMKGKIWVDSKPGTGAAFKVWLPIGVCESD